MRRPLISCSRRSTIGGVPVSSAIAPRRLEQNIWLTRCPPAAVDEYQHELFGGAGRAVGIEPADFVQDRLTVVYIPNDFREPFGLPAPLDDLHQQSRVAVHDIDVGVLRAQEAPQLRRAHCGRGVGGIVATVRLSARVRGPVDHVSRVCRVGLGCLMQPAHKLVIFCRLSKCISVSLEGVRADRVQFGLQHGFEVLDSLQIVPLNLVDRGRPVDPLAEDLEVMGGCFYRELFFVGYLIQDRPLAGMDIKTSPVDDVLLAEQEGAHVSQPGIKKVRLRSNPGGGLSSNIFWQPRVSWRCPPSPRAGFRLQTAE